MQKSAMDHASLFLLTRTLSSSHSMTPGVICTTRAIAAKSVWIEEPHRDSIWSWRYCSYIRTAMRIVAPLQNQGSNPRPWKLGHNTTGGVDEERKVIFVDNLTFLSMGITREVLITTRGPATAVEREQVSI